MKKYVILIVVLILSIIGSAMLSGGKTNTENNDLSDQTKVIENISISELSTLYAENYQFVDIRTEGEYNGQTGPMHLSSFTINLDYYQFENNLSMLNILDKDIPIVIICNSGNRSRSAANIMEDLGFKKIYNVENGIIACEGNDICGL